MGRQRRDAQWPAAVFFSKHVRVRDAGSGGERGRGLRGPAGSAALEPPSGLTCGDRRRAAWRTGIAAVTALKQEASLTNHRRVHIGKKHDCVCCLVLSFLASLATSDIWRLTVAWRHAGVICAQQRSLDGTVSPRMWTHIGERPNNCFCPEWLISHP